MGVEPAGEDKGFLPGGAARATRGRVEQAEAIRQSERRMNWRHRFGSFSIMRKSTVLLGVLVLLLLLAGGAYVLSLDAKPTVELVEKVFPDEQFPR